MKFIFFLFTMLVVVRANAQPATVLPLSLPPEIAYYDNQVSGLYIAHNNLYLLSESRLQDSAPARLYSIALADLEQKIKDTAFELPYRTIAISGLEQLREKMAAMGDKFEGLESMFIANNKVFLNVETNTPSPNCYLISGTLSGDRLVMNDVLVPVKKPRKENGQAIFNAGFEAMAQYQKKILMFYEYNYFGNRNFVYRFDRRSKKMDSVPMQQLPFRITDITHRRGKHFTAINFFFKGDTMPNGYVIDSTDADYAKTKSGKDFISYARLIDVKISRKKITWKPMAELPTKYHNYNWEGLARYKQGYFMVNDKYTPARPYETVLCYLTP